MHWTVTFFGNLAGSLFVMGLIIGYGGVFDSAAYKAEVIKFATTKAVTPEWHMVFLRGIGANWLVCLACFLALSARELFSKVVAIWWPVFAFVCLGFDHVVANMFFIPAAIFQGAPGISVGYYIWKSMIPALIGNIIGGGLFVGVMYWYLVRLTGCFLIAWIETDIDCSTLRAILSLWSLMGTTSHSINPMSHMASTGTAARLRLGQRRRMARGAPRTWSRLGGDLYVHEVRRKSTVRNSRTDSTPEYLASLQRCVYGRLVNHCQ